MDYARNMNESKQHGSLYSILSGAVAKLADQAPSLLILCGLVVYGLRELRTVTESHLEANRQHDIVSSEREDKIHRQLDRFASIMDASQTRLAGVIEQNARALGENSRVLQEVSRRLENMK